MVNNKASRLKVSSVENPSRKELTYLHESKRAGVYIIHVFECGELVL